jgi:hypothetical protein
VNAEALRPCARKNPNFLWLDGADREPRGQSRNGGSLGGRAFGG